MEKLSLRHKHYHFEFVMRMKEFLTLKRILILSIRHFHLTAVRTVNNYICHLDSSVLIINYSNDENVIKKSCHLDI